MPSSCSFTPRDHHQTKIKRPSRHTPHSHLPPEVVAKRNQRERRRVTSVNDEFSRLQRLLPSVRDRARRVPKERLLRLAARYIRDLSTLLLTADAQTGSRRYTPTGSSPEYYPQYTTDHDEYTDATMPTLEAPSICDSPCVLSSLPGFLHSVDPLRMPALEDAIQGADHTGSAPYHHLPAAGVSAPGCASTDGVSGLYQQHFRFRQHRAGYGGSSSGVWDTSCPPGGVSVNLTYYSSSDSYTHCGPTVCSTLGAAKEQEDLTQYYHFS